jgi:hypothetical protein
LKVTIWQIVIVAILLSSTVAAWGGCFYGWFLPKNLSQPVSLRDGSHRTSSGAYFIGRSHYGGGYRGGK